MKKKPSLINPKKTPEDDVIIDFKETLQPILSNLGGSIEGAGIVNNIPQFRMARNMGINDATLLKGFEKARSMMLDNISKNAGGTDIEGVPLVKPNDLEDMSERLGIRILPKTSGFKEIP